MAGSETTVGITNPLEGLLGYELRRASLAAMSAYASALDPLGLRPSDALMLLIIGANPGCTQSGLCRALMMQPANMTPVVRQLVQAGWLEKAPAEGRSVGLHLTKDGAALFDQIQRAVAQHEETITRRVPKGVRTELVNALRMICEDALGATDKSKPCPPAAHASIAERNRGASESAVPSAKRGKSV